MLALKNPMSQDTPWCPITSWQIDGETVADFIFLGSKITVDGDCRACTAALKTRSGADPCRAAAGHPHTPPPSRALDAPVFSEEPFWTSRPHTGTRAASQGPLRRGQARPWHHRDHGRQGQVPTRHSQEQRGGRLGPGAWGGCGAPTGVGRTRFPWVRRMRVPE